MYVWLGKAGQKSEWGREAGISLGETLLTLSILIYLTRPLQHLVSSCWKCMHTGTFIYICTMMLPYKWSCTCVHKHLHAVVAHFLVKQKPLWPPEKREEKLLINLTLSSSCTDLNASYTVVEAGGWRSHSISSSWVHTLSVAALQYILHTTCQKKNGQGVK